MILSTSDLVQGETYHVFVNDTQQSFTGTDVMMRPGGFGGQGGGGPMGGFGGGRGPLGENGELPEGMELPEDFDPSQRPQRPEGFELQDGQHPEKPEGFGPGERPEGPQGGGQPGDGQTPPELPEGLEVPEGVELPEAGEIVETGQARTDFYMQDKVNAFSGVANAAK